MQKRHQNRRQYFMEQGITTKKYVIPYIEEFKHIKNKTRVLEIGCGEGGNLTPFIEKECEVVGVDLDRRQMENAKLFISEKYPGSNIRLLNKNIYALSSEDIGKFDIVVLRDVIEHIKNQDKFLNHLRSLVKKNGFVFFGFPPWCMPFGGHQQICKSKILSKLPYFHLLPGIIYKNILKLFGENKETIDSLLEIKNTGIGISKFQNMVAKNNFQFLKKTFYLINPNYEIKFGLKPQIQFEFVQSIPYLRDFLTTCYYCLISFEETMHSRSYEDNIC